MKNIWWLVTTKSQKDGGRLSEKISFRKELKDSGVVDPFKTPVSKEHLNKFLNNYKKPGEVSDKPLIEANSGELLNILNSQDDAVWLLNNIVSNQSNELIPIAKNGIINGKANQTYYGEFDFEGEFFSLF